MFHSKGWIVPLFSTVVTMHPNKIMFSLVQKPSRNSWRNPLVWFSRMLQGPYVSLDRDRPLIRLPFTSFAVCTVLLPLTGLIACLFISLVYHFEEATYTHCHVGGLMMQHEKSHVCEHNRIAFVISDSPFKFNDKTAFLLFVPPGFKLLAVHQRGH